MRAQKVLAKDFQFYIPDLDNILLVECHENESVTVRATRDNFSEERKVFFIRKLATEGFIPDYYQWFSGSTDGSHGIVWVKDYSWLKIHPAVTQRSNRFMCRLLFASCLLLLAMLRILLASGPGHSPANPGAKPSRAVAMTDHSNARAEKTVPGSLVH
jgi:hypothetical protein